ncbi:S-adenosyl-L-methionine-dependent methyltransferase [Rhypophila decipiens]|uniref:S-adenosyl-L-methionine-dependent methyltransferase n=1 Tax=Rhypophila decipiens TaxID=261697 RepID=A0AAN6XW82_9PEZI|nr:S-adenosyl-L-methionine-dependent methyltransferase [Rhypophila decipiens]
MSSPPAQPATASAASPAAATSGSSPPTTALEPDVDAAPAGALDDDGNSAYGDSLVGSDTASMASSILKYRMENGRRYHAYKAGAYFMPNDDIENERLDLQHNLCVLIQGNKLFLAPVGKDKPLNRVLDAGTGTGIWAMDFADEHPEANVVGVDLSPIQPSFVPPNVEFFIDDLEADWTFIRPFDFIYCRMLTGSIRDWPKLFGQALRHLNPGGYIELHDPSNPLRSDDNTLPKDCALNRWNDFFLEASLKLGAPMNSSDHYEQQLKDAGFVNVTVVEEKWPINTWPRDKKYKEVGAWVQENIQQGLEALSLALFTNVLGWSPEQVQLLLVDVRKDLKKREYHAYWPVRTVYGQKPE